MNPAFMNCHSKHKLLIGHLCGISPHLKHGACPISFPSPSTPPCPQAIGPPPSPHRLPPFRRPQCRSSPSSPSSPSARRLLRLGGRGRNWIPPSRAAASSSHTNSGEKRPRPARAGGAGSAPAARGGGAGSAPTARCHAPADGG